MKQAPPTCDCQKCIFRDLMFEGLDLPELEIICRKKKETKYQKGDMVIQENETIHELLYLKSGLVKLFKHNENESDQIISIARPFDFIGLLSVFSDQQYNYSVTALEDTVVCTMDLDAVKDLVRHNGKFALTILEKISKTSDSIIKRNLEIGKKNLKGRIAYILLFFANNVYESDTFELPVSRKEIAEWIEMTTENVIRALSEFRKDQIINIKGKTIEILDAKRLQKISELG
jgi:CRP-like cAMP-binding protein